MNPRYLAVAERAGHRCEYCSAPEVVFNFPFEVEHVIPPSAGGDDDLSNLALSCRSCNVFKSAVVLVLDEETGADVRLFHPRQDQWLEHFHLNDDGQIEPLSATGRVTARQLRLNMPSQIAARRQWAKLGLYP
jgi:hypothetical protein